MKSKKQKREEAAVRQAARDGRSDEEQLARLDAHGWDATKERARLLARVAARRPASSPKPTPDNGRARGRKKRQKTS